MSDRDPLEQLAAFRTGPVSPLPAADVRRLGDQRRARRTATTVAAGVVAVLAVAVPSALWAARTGDDPVPPSSPSTPTPSLIRDDRDPLSIGLGDIPADFPLDVDWFDAGSEGRKRGPAAGIENDPPEACHTSGLAAGRADGRMALVVTAPEYIEQRELRTYPDAATAAAVLARIRADVASCTTYQSEGPITMGVMPIPLATGYDDVAFAQTAEPYATGFFLTRVGRAVVQVRAGGEWMTDSITTTGAAQYATLMRKLAAEMCGFTAGGCADTPTPTDRGGAVIPDGFPLASGWPDPATAENPAEAISGPSRALPALPITACGKRLPEPDSADRMNAGWHNVEDGRSRELRVFASAAEAVEYVDAIATFFRSCPVESDPAAQGMEITRRVAMTHTGGQSVGMVTGYRYKGDVAIGFGGIHAIRLGRAVLVLSAANEGVDDGEPIVDLLEPITTEASDVLSAMCVFTAKGC